MHGLTLSKPSILLTIVLALPFAFLVANAQADGYFCSSRLGPLAGGYSLCAGAGAGVTNTADMPSETRLIAPDAFSDTPVFASQTSTGSGIFTGFASAGSSANLGVLGASVSAEFFNAEQPVDGTFNAGAGARTDASLYDSGILVSAAGAPVGAPVSLRITIDAAGAFAGGPINAAPSEARVRLSVYLDDGRPVLFGGFSSTGVLLSKVSPFAVVPIDLTGFRVGDRLAFGLRLETSANATNKLPSSKATDITARLYVDVPSANANFVSASGHLYGLGASPAPAPVPDPVTATAGDAQATVSFAAPASAGGSAITGYTVTSFPGGITATGTVAPIIVTGLTNGTAYTFTVTASNAAGMSVASAPSNSVTPTAGSAPVPAPVGGGGGGSVSMPLLLVLSAAHWWRRRVNRQGRAPESNTTTRPRKPS